MDTNRVDDSAAKEGGKHGADSANAWAELAAELHSQPTAEKLSTNSSTANNSTAEKNAGAAAAAGHTPGGRDLSPVHGHDIDFQKDIHSDKFNSGGILYPKHQQFDQPVQPIPFPTLPSAYRPTKEDFSGVQVTGISQEFLKNLQSDQFGQYYGAGLEYPDIVSDSKMKQFLDDENKATLSRIDKNVLETEQANEKKAASFKLPASYENASAAQSIIDATLGDGGNASMSTSSRTYTLTEDGAPHRQLLVDDGSGSRTLIPNQKDFVIEQVAAATVNGQDKLAVVGSKDGASVLYIYDSEGHQEKQIPLPGYGTLHDARQGATDSQLQFLYDTPVAAPRVLTVDMAGDKASFSAPSDVAFNSNDFVTDKLMVPYTDRQGNAEKVPVYVSHRKDVQLDGKNPAMLDIYGGFNIAPQWLRYYPHSASWLEQGGVVVDPVLPGDGGLGTDNYHEGMGAGIENTDLALAAAVKKVQDLGYSSPETTGIYGRSNGGMVVNTILNKRPDLFGAAVTESGVDSLFDNPNINVDTGRYWEDEFGDPSNSSDVGWMSKLDVLSNTTADKHYPATLIEIGTKDGVVNVGNGITLASIRQQMNNGEALLYTRYDEGHDPSSLDLQTAFLWDRLTHH